MRASTVRHRCDPATAEGPLHVASPWTPDRLDGGSAAPDLPARARTCKTPIKVSTFPDGSGVNLAVASGRADAALADSPVAAYAAKQSGGKLEVVGSSYGNAPFGIAVPKSSALTELLKSALERLKATGGYQQILTDWGLQSGALDQFQINAAS